MLLEQGLQVRAVHLDPPGELRYLATDLLQPALEKVPYAAIVGDKEVAGRTVALRLAGGVQVPGVALGDFVAGVCAERDTRALASPWGGTAPA